jgi:tetratricopeptide (TPR) repeat protein
MLKGVLAARTEKLGASDAATLGTQISLAELYEERGDFALGETLRHKALATCTAMLGPDHLNTLDSHVGLAMFYWAQKKLDQAISHLQLALTGRKAAIPDHPDTLGTQAELGRLYCDAGRFLDAIPLLEEVRQKDRENTDLLKQTGQPLLIAYARTGKATKATVLALEQAEAARKEFSADRSKLAAALASAGRWLVEAKSYAAAEPLLRESLSLGEAQVPVSWTTHHARSLLGHALLRQQKYADAEPHLVQGYLGMKVRVAEIPAEERGYLRTARERVFELYTAWGKPDEAAKWREQLAANTKTAEKVVPQK